MQLLWRIGLSVTPGGISGRDFLEDRSGDLQPSRQRVGLPTNWDSHDSINELFF